MYSREEGISIMKEMEHIRKIQIELLEGKTQISEVKNIQNGTD